MNPIVTRSQAPLVPIVLSLFFLSCGNSTHRESTTAPIESHQETIDAHPPEHLPANSPQNDDASVTEVEREDETDADQLREPTSTQNTDEEPERPSVVLPRGMPVDINKRDQARCRKGRRVKARRQGECNVERRCSAKSGKMTKSRLRCLPPGWVPGGGMARALNPVIQTECSEGEIVVLVLSKEPDPTIWNLHQECRPDCRIHGCDAQSICFADGFCRLDCRTHGCGPNTTCRDGGDGWAYCQRTQCKNSSDCDCGACVSGTCYDGPGRCFPAENRP